MPLVTRQVLQGNVYNQETEPPNWNPGDIWVQTSTGHASTNVAGVATAIGDIIAANDTLTVEADVLDSGVMTSFDEYMVMFFIESTGANTHFVRFNEDATSGNYNSAETKQGTSGKNTTNTGCELYGGSSLTDQNLQGFFIVSNKIATHEKMLVGESYAQDNNSAQFGGRWENTSDLITRIQIVNTGAGGYGIGSYMVVYGRNYT